jgi:hypothetical protein
MPTTPEVIRQVFGVDTVTDWAEAAPSAHGLQTGRTRTEDDVLRGADALVYALSLMSVSDPPEHYQEVSRMLAESDGRTVVTVSETNSPSDEAKVVPTGRGRSSRTSGRCSRARDAVRPRPSRCDGSVTGVLQAAYGGWKTRRPSVP